MKRHDPFSRLRRPHCGYHPEIPPQDIRAAAFNLLAVYKDFSAGTIHVVVVDPGVGSARRGIIMRLRGTVFCGPDNGIIQLESANEKELSRDQFNEREVLSASCEPRLSRPGHLPPVAAGACNGVDPARVRSADRDPSLESRRRTGCRKNFSFVKLIARKFFSRSQSS